MRGGANILFFILGGWLLALTWYFAALVMTLSVIGLPWARACWELGTMSLKPFGRDVVSHAELKGESTVALGAFRLIANLLWLPFGFALAVMHAVHGALMFCTLIGIPLGLQDFKLAGLALFPVGKRVVSIELAKAARASNAAAQLEGYRR
jgi:uncharacterized membrane protein YccF (DUF307 family)